MVTSESIISVRLAIPSDGLLAPLFPRGNRWASFLLCRLLQKRIEAAGFTVESAHALFEFNASFYQFAVLPSPAGPALAAVLVELSAVGLLSWSQIAWREQTPAAWRLFYPKSGVFMAPAKEEFEAEARIAAEGNEAIRKLLERYGTPGG